MGMSRTFINSENCRTSDPNGLGLILTNKMDLSRMGKRVALTDLSIYYR